MFTACSNLEINQRAAAATAEKSFFKPLNIHIDSKHCHTSMEWQFLRLLPDSMQEYDDDDDEFCKQFAPFGGAGTGSGPYADGDVI
jgi:hypothetical protein